MRHALCVLLVFILLAPGVIRAEKEITLGTVEEVILLPWGVKLLARIDTGATTTSLDARELKIEGKVVEFRLPDRYEGRPFRLPIIEWKEVLSAEGRGRRPVVDMDLCIGSRQIRARVNLNDRSEVKYPLIIGRNVLKHHFIVDVRRARVTEPECPIPPVDKKPVLSEPLPAPK